ncbi:MAG: hypothetical protein SFY95_05725 [Planctomycetota bacterium]|nr:hypothetical protein [Planctomycetota bacterium]
MHDPTSEGNDFFRCDFCLAPWREDRPMVEGHRGSLICGLCLTRAYRALYLPGDSEPAVTRGGECALCLEYRDEPVWRAPAIDGHKASAACARCVNNAAKLLSRDAESGWAVPQA